MQILHFRVRHVQHIFTYLINEVGNEKYKGEYTGDECTCPDVLWLTTRSLGNDGRGRWAPVPVSTLNNTAENDIFVLNKF